MFGVLEFELDRGRCTQASANLDITGTQPNRSWPADLASVPPDLSNLIEGIPNHVSFTLYKKMATLSGAFRLIRPEKAETAKDAPFRLTHFASKI
jgi:hypothetical protein